MKRLRLSLMAAAAVLAAPLVGAQTVLTVSTWLPPTHGMSMAQKEWCDLLEKNTSGKMKCNILPRGVTNAPGTFDAIKNGLADISFTVHGYTPGRFIYTQMAEFPFLGNSAEPISIAFNRVASRYPEIVAEQQGVKVITFFTHGPGIVFNTKRPITKVEDLAGLKFRVGGGMVNEISKNLGMNVTLKPAPDSYELLSGGVMDGTLFPAESTESFKIDKIIKHATTFPGGLYNTSFVFFMNEAVFNKLSKQDQGAIMSISGEGFSRAIGRTWDNRDREANAALAKANMATVHASAGFVDEVKKKTASLEGDWIKDANAKGLDGAKVLAEFREEIARAAR